jgi:hypothetical protein
MLRQSSHILESIPDLLHNISVLKHVARLPFNYYAFHDDVLSVCFRYPTRLARTLPTKITLEDGSVTDVNLMPMTWAMDTTLLLDPSREYGPVQRYRLREGSNHVVRHVLSTSVPADVRPVDPEWQKLKALHNMAQMMVKVLRQSAPGLQLYGLTEVVVPDRKDSVIGERGNVRAMLTSTRYEGVEYLNIEIRVTMFALATSAKIVAFEGGVFRDQQ